MGKLRDNMWRGERCFLVGGGPSLKGFDWSLLQGERVIAINRAFEFCNPDIIFGVDPPCYEAIVSGTSKGGQAAQERFANSKALKVWINANNNTVRFADDVVVLSSAGRSGLTKRLSDGLCCCGNSGYAALNLAIILGCREIYLLGYDMQGGKDGKQANFHSGYQGEKQDATIYDKFRRPFEQASADIKHLGVRVVNCNPNSALRCFEFGWIGQDAGRHKRRAEVTTLTSANRANIQDVIPDGAWGGQRCFIVGGGPSLKDFDFSRLRGELVIGCNRAFEKIDPALFVSLDTRFLLWLLDGRLGSMSRVAFESSIATKIWRDEENPSTPFPNYVYLLSPKNNASLPVSLSGQYGALNNSGAMGLCAAVSLGCKEIYLLGFDMKGDARTGKQAWFHDGYPTIQKAGVYEQKFIPQLNEFAEQLKPLGVRVINLNRDSALRCFEFGDVENITPKPERPLVISYYTRDTGYEVEVRKMIASAHRMGMECDVRGIDTRGGWQANTYYKASFIRRMMNEYQDRPLLWLDADVEVKRYPAIFDNLTADIAVNIVDWSKYSTIRRTDKELNTSVVYVRPNDVTRALFDVWIEANAHRQSSGVWEQKVFQDVLEGHEGAVKVEYLPDSYCQIFDLMRDAGDPVIELHQASRKLKREVGA